MAPRKDIYRVLSTERYKIRYDYIIPVARVNFDSASLENILKNKKFMKLLVLCPGKIPKSISDIHCFTDVINHYLPLALSKVCECDIKCIPAIENEELKKIFSTIEVDQYDAIVTLGLRFYSKISKETTNLLRSRFKGLFCQTHDGSRLDQDPVDITFTFKNDSQRLSVNPGWYARHVKSNEYIGWAADPDLNSPKQASDILRILVDHTNYGGNEIDKTIEVLKEIQLFVDSKIWKNNYQSVSIRRFDSGEIVDVDLNDLSFERYNKNKTIPISEISKEHSAAHIFCVTHPESVGLVVLETAMAGAFIVSPKGFISRDRLDTVRHYEWENSIDWNLVLKSINITESRNTALKNSWSVMAERIVDTVTRSKTNVSN
jgi:hypothetical protein